MYVHIYVYMYMFYLFIFVYIPEPHDFNRRKILLASQRARWNMKGKFTFLRLEQVL